METTNKYLAASVEDLPGGQQVIGVPQPPPPDKSVGAPGVAVYNGFLLENERDPRVTGVRKYKTYADILANVSIVSAACRLFLSLVSKAGWTVQPADESAEAKKYAEIVEHAIHDMDTPWHRVVRRAALFRFYGFGLQEWTAKMRDDGVVAFQDVEARAQSTVYRWDVDAHGEVLGVVQLSPQNQQEIYLPRGKLVYLVDDSMNDSPEGLGLFRQLVKAADALDRFELLEAWGYETDIRGIPLLRVPLTELDNLQRAGKLSAQEVAAIKQPFVDIVNKHIKSPNLSIMMDSETFTDVGPLKSPSSVKKYDLELLRGEQGPHQEVAAAIERKNREMARVLGVEHLLLGSDSKGSHAMSQDKSQTFGEIVDSTIVEICAGFRSDLLCPMWQLNGWDEKLMPWFVVDALQFRDIQSVTGALLDLANAGATLMPGDPAVNKVRNLIGVPEVPEEMQNMALDLATRTQHPGDQSGDQSGDQQGNQDGGAQQDGNQDAGDQKGQGD